MPSQAISTSPSAAGSALPCGSVKRAVTRPPLCSTPTQRCPVMKFSGADPLAHRGQQHALQVGAQQRDMRPQMAGRLAERLAIDELAVPREEGVVLRLAGGRDQRVLEPERAQLLHRMRADVDADAERPHFGAASNTRMRRATPEACSAKASAEPPIPPPMTIASMSYC